MEVNSYFAVNRGDAKMIEKIFETRCGNIHYWISDNIKDNLITLMFLPGLTADHRLFEKQIEYFESKYNVFVWDAPAHASSWPFSFEFSLKDKAHLHRAFQRPVSDCTFAGKRACKKRWWQSSSKAAHSTGRRTWRKRIGTYD